MHLPMICRVRRVLAAIAIVSPFAGSAVHAADAVAGAPRPNIVFFLADDLGIDAVGCYGSDRFKHKTPNIDALAANGVRFDHCFSMPLCGPSRCVLMTGRYGFRTGGLTNDSANVPSAKSEPSVARILSQAGYVTGTTGKWRQMGETPAEWGFTESMTDFHSHANSESKLWTRGYNINGKELTFDHDVYYPDEETKFAIDFFTRHRDEPFYFYFSERLVHAPIVRTPDVPDGLGPVEAYDATIAYLDKQVGRVTAALESLGLGERTLIVFAGDNGTSRNADIAKQTNSIGGRHIQGRKGELLEGGSRVPLVANWPAAAPKGLVVHDLVDFSDLLPTFADLANARLPSEHRFDGRSFGPQLRGEPGRPRDWVFVQLGNAWYARDRDWKLTSAGKLFSMRDAPFAETLIPAESADASAVAARSRLQAVLDELKPAEGKTEPGAAQDANSDKAKKPKKPKKPKKDATADQ